METAIFINGFLCGVVCYLISYYKHAKPVLKENTALKAKIRELEDNQKCNGRD